MYLLDTNHCSRALNRDLSIGRQLATIRRERVRTSVVVQAELYFMAYRSRFVQENLAQVQSFLSSVSIYTVDSAIAAYYGSLKADLIGRFGPKERAKQRQFDLVKLGIADNDVWIAATAIRHDLIVVTSDNDFARIAAVSNLRYESWLRDDLSDN